MGIFDCFKKKEKKCFEIKNFYFANFDWDKKRFNLSKINKKDIILKNEDSTYTNNKIEKLSKQKVEIYSEDLFHKLPNAFTNWERINGYLIEVDLPYEPIFVEDIEGKFYALKENKPLYINQSEIIDIFNKTRKYIFKKGWYEDVTFEEIEKERIKINKRKAK